MARRWPASLLAVCLAVGLAAVPASAQTVEELIARNLEAKGGLERLQAIRTVKQVSRLSVPGLEGTMTIYAKRPNLTRQEMVLGGHTVVQAYDGETAWTLNPLAGVVEPTAVSGPEAESIKAQAAFDSPFVDYKSRGFEIELVGREVLGTSAVYHLTLTSANGQVQHAYLDAATGLEVRIVTQTASGRLEQDLTDYRNVDGVMKPYLIRLTANDRVVAEVRVTTIQFNVDLKDELFRR
jgi:outer membrane lipoprotein-sorting protein